MPQNSISVFIVDDHSLIIEGLRASLHLSNDIKVIGHALTGMACIDFLKKNDVDVVIMDINLPDISGLELCQEVVQIKPEIKILGLSTFNQRNYISKFMDNGARGYVLKNTDVHEIQEAIHQVYRGNIFICKEAGNTLYKKGVTRDEENNTPSLTKRELEVLKLLADGLTAPEVGEKIHVSQLTVESHRRNIMAKLKAKNTAMLVKIAIERELI